MVNYPCVEAITWCLALTFHCVDTICSVLRALNRRRCFSFDWYLRIIIGCSTNFVNSRTTTSWCRNVIFTAPTQDIVFLKFLQSSLWSRWSFFILSDFYDSL